MFQNLMKWIKARRFRENNPKGQGGPKYSGSLQPGPKAESMTSGDSAVIRETDSSAYSGTPLPISSLNDKNHKPIKQPGIIFAGLQSKISSDELIRRVSHEIELEGLKPNGPEPEKIKKNEMNQTQPLTGLDSTTQGGF